MKRLALAVAFACVLTSVVRAGEIHTTGAVAPPTPNTVTAAGEIPTSGVTGPQEPAAVLTIILAILGIVP